MQFLLHLLQLSHGLTMLHHPLHLPLHQCQVLLSLAQLAGMQTQALLCLLQVFRGHCPGRQGLYVLTGYAVFLFGRLGLLIYIA